MFALPGVFVFVQRTAVKPGETVRVLGEMSGHPVENHANAGQMTGIHKCPEVVGRPEPTGRCKISGDLVPPRGVIGMFHHRHQLDVREAEPGDVRNQFVNQLAPRQRSVLVLGFASPRTRVHFVRRHRRVEGNPTLCPRIDPRVVLPHVLPEVSGDRRGLGWMFSAQGKRVCLGKGRPPERRLHLELVRLTSGHAGYKRLPQTAGAKAVEWVRPSIPTVEVAHHRHTTGRRCPHHKRVPDLPITRRRSSAQLLPAPQPGAFAKQIGFVVGNDPGHAPSLPG